MPDTAELAMLRRRLEEELASLLEDADIRRAGSSTVELDQTRTGRLSRMDALQGQAMARATEARATQRAQRLQAALRRHDEGTYGECVRCGEFIAPGRLRADPAAAVCISCAESAESR